MKIGTKTTMTMKKSFYLSAALLSLVACSRSQEIDVPDAHLSIYARTESPADTKTVVEEGVHVYWEPGDEIVVFMGDKMAKFSTDLTAASGTATFKGTFGDAAWPEDLDLWAVYPFSEEATFDGETITTTFPSEQVAREGSFGKDMNLSIAHSTGTTLQFYNVGGGIRFSVTEEGIKKVMFEGLSGEIISGKVKIGFENGVPEVKEVTGGSQFITLLPPAGKETFEPSAWYYIVAIPGSLEGGYKLRFYKDSDYARKVNEKKVEIKRSVFGNLEKADEGIEYEATTTKFPETEEEWEASLERTNEISVSLKQIISSMQTDSEDSLLIVKDFIEQALQIEGVSNAFEVGDNIGAVIIQEDAVHLNVLLSHSDQYDSHTTPLSETIQVSETPRLRSAVTPYSSDNKALVIAPYQSRDNGLWHQFFVDAQSINRSLDAINYSMDWAPDDFATLEVFSPSTLSDYNLIVIATHGNYEGFTDLEGNDVGTVLLTGSKEGTVKFDSPDYKKLALFLTVGSDSHYAVSSPWYEGVERSTGTSAILNNTIVVAMACNSYRYDDLANYFTSRGASIYYGNEKEVAIEDAVQGLPKLVDYLCMGMSVRNAVEMMRIKDFTFLGQSFFPGRLSRESNGTAYLINATPTNLHNSEIRDGRTTLIWEQQKNTGEYKFKVYLKGPNSGSYSAFDSTTSKAYTTDVLQPGEYTWYVEAYLYYDGKVIETFTSDTKRFTVTEEFKYETPEAVDLGLSVKWSSFNLGATKPEEYGYYYAWGETEPKSDYSWETYKWCMGSENTLTKYCYNSEYGYNGFVDNKQVLDPEDDAAQAALGGSWRMPTDEEWTELLEKCSWEWTSLNGVNGRQVTGPNGKNIFLPAAGGREAANLYLSGSLGNYWSSSLSTSTPDFAWFARFSSSSVFRATITRFYGWSIRPVYGDNSQCP